MAPISRDPPGSDPPDEVCVRCSKPIRRGTASQIAGPAVHMRCLVLDTQLQAMELHDRAELAVLAARAAQARALELIDKVRRYQTSCRTCGERLASSCGVLFQGDDLVHAGCWRSDADPLGPPPPVS